MVANLYQFHLYLNENKAIIQKLEAGYLGPIDGIDLASAMGGSVPVLTLISYLADYEPAESVRGP